MTKRRGGRHEPWILMFDVIIMRHGIPPLYINNIVCFDLGFRIKIGINYDPKIRAR